MYAYKVHGLNETASALLGKFNRRCVEASVVLLFAAVRSRRRPEPWPQALVPGPKP